MAKGYYLSVDGGKNFEAEALLTTADITNSFEHVASYFRTVKDSKDNIFIWCGFTGNSGEMTGVVLRVSKTGVVAKVNLTWSRAGDVTFYEPNQFILSRDEKTLFWGHVYGGALLDTEFINGSTIDTYNAPAILNQTGCMFAIYQDRYIWVASGGTVSVYDYTTKALINSEVFSQSLKCICCSMNNELFVVNTSTLSGYFIDKYVLNGIIISRTTYTITENITQSKQIIIDKWGDLVILTNSGTASHLLKYTTAGVLKDDVDLSVAEILGVGRTAYSLNVYSTRNQDGSLKDCQVSFENDLGLWLSEPVPAQGQHFGAFTKLLNTGNITASDNGGDNNYSVRC